MDHYVPRDWQPHERPGLPGSPSTPRHPNAKRFAYGLVGLLVALTGGLGNSLVIANLPYLQGALGVCKAIERVSWVIACGVSGAHRNPGPTAQRPGCSRRQRTREAAGATTSPSSTTAWSSR